MIDLLEVKDQLADYVATWPGLKIGAQKLSLLGSEVYIWAEVTGPISRATLREVQVFGRQFPFRCVANVDVNNATAIRFAEFFGFRKVARQRDVFIMEKC